MTENSQQNTPPQESATTSATLVTGSADQNERTLALVCHLSLFASFIIPFASVIIPLVIWLMKRETSPFIDEVGKEVLNFQISLFIYFIACTILMVIVIGILLAVALAIAAIVLAIMGTVAASKGESYRYPYILRLIK